ncbi:MAG: hypothetical protein ACTSW4_01750 [Candidatus Ranarchaeia archaeon]
MVSSKYWTQLMEIQQIRGGDLAAWPDGLGQIVKMWRLDRMIDGYKIVKGRLVLTPKYLLFFEDAEGQDDRFWGPVSWGTLLVEIRSIEIQPYFMMQQQMVIRFLESDVATFNVPVNLNGKKMGDLILSFKLRAKAAMHKMSGASTVGEETDDVAEMLLEAVKAYRGMPVIPFDVFYALVRDKEKATKAMIQRRLVWLLAKGRIVGQLTADGFRREIVGTVQCQVCDQAEVDPVVFWQCPQCYRTVCATCQKKQPQCPAHPELPTQLVKMPFHCPHCHAVVGELRAVTDLLCQQCGTPLRFG